MERTNTILGLSIKKSRVPHANQKSTLASLAKYGERIDSRGGVPGRWSNPVHGVVELPDGRTPALAVACNGYIPKGICFFNDTRQATTEQGNMGLTVQHSRSHGLRLSFIIFLVAVAVRFTLAALTYRPSVAYTGEAEWIGASLARSGQFASCMPFRLVQPQLWSDLYQHHRLDLLDVREHPNG